MISVVKLVKREYMTTMPRVIKISRKLARFDIGE